ncbi:MAG: tRNA pseudouridine(38-40) synthase TruA [Treponema sp.]|jgi:tRNA pseudouridine38-40 synthase|nr:tRNA pseudouridine(38-40) synthase TruA [Treponema sp.]
MNNSVNLRNILLLIAYDGTDFSGWQRQKTERTVQGEIEKALETLHKRPVALTGSGRTDSGVHARGQAANFFSDIIRMEAERFVPALNSLLPHDVRILEAREVTTDFHARFDALSRTYRYFFIPGFTAFPTETRYALRLFRQPDLSLLNNYCRILRGEFDCTVFAVPADKSKSRHRYIFFSSFFAEKDKIVFEIKANAFLWKMVRSIAGTLLFYEEQKLGQNDFFRVISSGKRELAGPTLPPEGLFLWNVEY